MIAIVFYACLIADPAECGNRRLVYDDPAFSLITCMKSGQGAIAEWAESHPSFIVRKWRCEVAGVYADL